MRLLTPSLLASLLVVAPLAFAQNEVATPTPLPSAPDPTAASNQQLLTLPALQQLVSPIALDPDPLLALMLPAAAHIDQIQSVAANPAGADDPSIDPSVQGLAHYPEILNWMAANVPWTQELGNAFVTSPTDVMAAVQSLRQRAQAAGTLVPSNYEQVSVDADGQIEILPAQPSTLYVPAYDPAVVYWTPPPGYVGGFFGWSNPYPVGAWLTFDFDWHSHALWQGDWYGYQRAHGGWNHPIDFAHVNVSAAIGRGHAWQPPARSAMARPSGNVAQNRPESEQYRGRPAAPEQPRAETERPTRTVQAPNGHPAPATRAPLYPVPTQRPAAHPIPTRPSEPRPAQAPRAQERAPEERRPEEK